MKLRVSFHARYLALLGALGLPVACSTVEANDFPCSESSPEIVQGQDSGYAICTEGARHRPTPATCASALPRADTCDAGNPEFPGTCTTDADCTERPHGQCGIFGQLAECTCTYGCVTDADCDDGRICDCGDPVGQCVRADCTSDADCAGDLLCVAYVSDPGCGGTAFTCQSELDLCASDADCENGANCTKVGERLECQQVACAIGRPFLVEGAHRTADEAARRDWLGDEVLAPCLDGLSPELLEELAAHWSEVALMEHASIAAFARFAMQLLSLGAPPELLMETYDAMRDETRHATLAFALASAYARRDIGPGSLCVDGAFDNDSPTDILRMVVREGCIGETIAAIEAAEAAEHATDPVVKAVLDQIAADEQRHAELAWRYVAWAIDDDARLADTLLAEIDAVAREADPRRSRALEGEELLRHGVVSAPLCALIRERALANIITPTALTLAGRWVAEDRRSERVVRHHRGGASTFAQQSSNDRRNWGQH